MIQWGRNIQDTSMFWSGSSWVNKIMTCICIRNVFRDHFYSQCALQTWQLHLFQLWQCRAEQLLQLRLQGLCYAGLEERGWEALLVLCIKVNSCLKIYSHRQFIFSSSLFFLQEYVAVELGKILSKNPLFLCTKPEFNLASDLKRFSLLFIFLDFHSLDKSPQLKIHNSFLHWFSDISAEHVMSQSFRALCMHQYLQTEFNELDAFF